MEEKIERHRYPNDDWYALVDVEIMPDGKTAYTDPYHLFVKKVLDLVPSLGLIAINSGTKGLPTLMINRIILLYSMEGYDKEMFEVHINHQLQKLVEGEEEGLKITFTRDDSMPEKFADFSLN